MSYLSVVSKRLLLCALTSSFGCGDSAPSVIDAGHDASRSDAATADVSAIDVRPNADVALDALADSSPDVRVADASSDVARADAAQTDAARSDATTDGPMHRDGGADVILSYNYGSQILGSRLEIYLDGSYELFERSCCPPGEVPTTGTLNAVQLDALTLNIVAIGESTDEMLDGMPSALGSPSGTLEVQGSGSLRVVQNIVRAPGISGNDTVTRSRAVAARNAILDLVDGLTTQDMYRLP